METENAYKIWEMRQGGVVIPTGANEGNFTLYVADNIDRLEETLDGFNTTHNVNNFIIRNGKFGNLLFDSDPKKKRCRRSFIIDNYDDQQNINIHGSRIAPKGFKFYKIENSEHVLSLQRTQYLAWVFLRKINIDRLIPSWTGFQILVTSNILLVKSGIGYMDSIDSPASDITTICQIMNRALDIKTVLKLPEIVCVFDQAIYAKAAEIKWKSPAKYQTVVIMLGTFHLLMMYMGVLCKRFKDAGLFDVLVQGSVLAEYSCDRALSGKMYNRGVRAYKIVYEALISQLIENVTSSNIDVILPCFSSEELTPDSLHDFITSNEFCQFRGLFDEQIRQFSESSDDNRLRKFWLS